MKKMKKTGFLTLFLVVLLFMSFLARPVHADLSPFKDVKETDWFFQYVVNLKKWGIIDGYPDGTFRPDTPVIRKHAAKMIANATGSSASGESVNFTDFTSQDEMAPYVAALIKVGAIKGYPDGSFRPDQNIERGHVCKIVLKAFNLEVKTWVPDFIDYPKDEEVKEAIGTLGADHIVKGYKTSAGLAFRPAEHVTRAQLAKILCLSLAVAMVERADKLRTVWAVDHAQAIVDALPDDQDATLKYSLNNWLYDILDAVNSGVFGSHYWRDVEAINRLIEKNGLEWVKWQRGQTFQPSGWKVEWTSKTLKRIEKINIPGLYQVTGKIDFNALTELKVLSAYQNKITELKLDKCRQLENLLCYENNLSSLDLSGLNKLEKLDCSHNKEMTSLNLEGCSALTTAVVSTSKLSSILWDKLPSLEIFYCAGNNLQGTLDVSGLPKLVDLRCGGNNLTRIRLRSPVPVKPYQYLDVSYNKLKSPKDVVNGEKYPWDDHPNFKFKPQK